MDISVILSYRSGIRAFYADIPHMTIAEAGLEPLKIRHLSEHQRRITLPSGKSVDMGTAFLLACVGSIEAKYRNRNQLSTDDEMYVAKRMVEDFSHWSINDVKCYEDMLVGGRLPSMTYGDVTYELPTVNIPNLLSKAEVYDKMRPTTAKEADDNPKSMQALLEKRTTGWRKSPFNIYSDYHKTHDSDGNLVVDPRDFGGTPPDNPGWDYESHWDQWYRTHKLGGEPAPDDFDPIAYWLTRPDPEYNLDEDAFMNGVAKKDKQFTNKLTIN